MAFWSTQRVEHEQITRHLLDPFEAENIHQGAYELTLSHQVVATSPEGEDNQIRRQPQAFVIAPGQFAILYSREVVKIPANVIGFISVKSSFKADGLINISGFHVDPGFEGRLRFSVYNAGGRPVVLKLGDPTFQIWFADMDAPTRDPYRSVRQNQLVLTSNELATALERPASPAVLARRISDLERELKHLRTVLYSGMLPLYVGFLCVLLAALLAYFQSKISASTRQEALAQPVNTKH